MELNGLPQVDAWCADLGSFDLRTFMLSNVSIAEACSVIALMSPGFVEYRGCIFLDFVFDASGVDAWIDRFDGVEQSVESAVNHVHLWDFFSPKSEAENDALVELAHRMVESWKSSALMQFPGREFVVQFSDGSDDYGPTLVIYAG
ncbi:hypothetical protein [Amycolatopsis pittospori]|uniref:hypothetical protein n=1 Tax=Amycolatopsis pittospori TaxID=2749434 RepID=UPI0015F08309|nr:hypothetical protein [Amycolatopsis pittospori]